MANLEDKPKSFFMFCMSDFATRLSIPKEFAESYRDFFLQKTMQLTTESGQSWEVEIKNINGDFFIVNGWSDFAKDNNLVEMMVLVFRIVASSTLHVAIFGQDSCLKLPPPSSSNPSDQGEKTWRFVKELKKYNITGQRMEIPKDFAEGSGIATCDDIKLQDESGRKWPINITNRNISMYSMTGGWMEFLKDNGLRHGAILLFEFVPGSGNVVKVVAMEERAGRKLLSQARYGGCLKS